MRNLIILFLLSFCVLTHAQPKLSDAAEISVLTVGPGPQINDAFGHSGFRIKDSTLGLDLVFNYGVYDFEAPNFVLKFARGKLNYLIGVNRFDNFFRAYAGQNRSVKQQTLNLSQSEKQKLYDLLVENYLPENRRYLYDFFFDNCATKIKDVANQAVNGAIIFNIPEDYQEATFRTLIQNNLHWNTWGSLGIDCALGAVVDIKATPEQHMFLPENIHRFFHTASLSESNTPLIKGNQLLYKQRAVKKESNFILSPIVIFGIIGLIILLITYRDYRLGRQTKVLDIFLFGITGLVGIGILLLWFATDHESTHQNYNLLWANPLNLIGLFQLLKKPIKTWFKRYLKFLIILLLLMVFHWIVGVQVFALGLIPFLIALTLRYLFLIRYLKTS